MTVSDDDPTDSDRDDSPEDGLVRPDDFDVTALGLTTSRGEPVDDEATSGPDTQIPSNLDDPLSDGLDEAPRLPSCPRCGGPVVHVTSRGPDGHTASPCGCRVPRDD